MVSKEVKKVLEKYGYNPNNLNIDQINYILDLIIKENEEKIQNKLQELSDLIDDIV